MNDPYLYGILAGVTLLAIGLAGPGSPARRLRDAIACAALTVLLGAVVAIHIVVMALRPRTAPPLPRRRPPALPVDGEPLGEDEDGEAETFAALIYAYRNVSIPEPVYGPGADRGPSC